MSEPAQSTHQEDSQTGYHRPLKRIGRHTRPLPIQENNAAVPLYHSIWEPKS